MRGAKGAISPTIGYRYTLNKTKQKLEGQILNYANAALI